MTLLIQRLILSTALFVCSSWQWHPDQEAADDGSQNLTKRSNTDRKIIVSTVLEAPYMMLKERQPFLAGNERFEGYLADILLRLSITIGFEYEIRLVRDGKYGMLGPMGYWDGMVGEVHRGDADLAAGPLTITSRRLEAVDFTEPFLSLRSTALIRKPRPNKRRLDGRKSTHLKLVLQEETPEPEGEDTLQEEAAISGRDSSEEPRSRARIRRIERLLDSDMVFGVREGSLTQRFLRTSQDEMHKRMWTKMVNFWPSAFVHSDEEGVARVRSENFAFILDMPAGEFIAQRRPCDLYTLEPFLDLRQYAFAMRKGDRLLRDITMTMREMTRSRELSNMYLNWWEGQCSKRFANNARRESHSALSTPSPWKQATDQAPSSSSEGLCRAPWVLLTAALLFMFF